MRQRRLLLYVCLFMLLLITAIPAAAHSGNEPDPPETVMPQVTALVGAALAAGGALYWLWFGTPDTASTLRRITGAGIAALGLAVVLALWGRGAITGLSPDRALAEPLLNTLVGIPFGVVWIVALVGWILTASLWFAHRRQASLIPLVILLPLTFPALIEILGHTPTPEHTLARSAAGWLYQAAQALTLGIVISFVLTGGMQRRASTTRQATVVVRWLLLATVAGWALVGALQVGFPGQIVTTDYGRGVILVTAAWVISAVLALANRTLRNPRLTFAEIGAGVVLLGVLLLNSGTSAPVNPYSEGFVSLYFQDDETEITLTIEPGYVGMNRFTVLFNDPATGRPAATINGAALTFTLNEQRSGFPLTKEVEGVFSALDEVLNQAGTWQIEIAAQRTDGSQIVSPFHAQIDSSPVPDEAALTAGVGTLLLPLVGVVGAALLAAALMAWTAERTGKRLTRNRG